MKLNIQLFADGKVVIETELDTDGFEDGLDDLEDDSKLKMVIEAIKEKFVGIGDTIKKSLETTKTGLKKIGTQIVQVGAVALKTIGKVILSIAGIGIALVAALGVVGLLGLGFLALTSALDKDEKSIKQFKTDIQYIIFSIRTALQPIIDIIAEKIKKALEFIITIFQYIMAIANVLAGRNLFENATPKKFAKYMKDADKSAKDIKKQLAGFDEMNILGKNTGKTGESIGTPSFDASSLGDIQKKVEAIATKVKNFLQPIEDFLERLRNKLGIKSWKVTDIGEQLGKKTRQFFIDLAATTYNFFTKQIPDAVKELIQKIKDWGATIYNYIDTKIFNPTGNRLLSIMSVIRDVFNLPITLGIQVGAWLTTHFTKLINSFIDGINLAFGFLGIHIDHFEIETEGAGDSIVTNIVDNLSDAVDETANIKDGINKIPKNTTTTINVKANTTKARKSIAELIGDIGKAGMDGALGLDNYIKSMEIIKARKGAIINMPGRGVPVSSVVGGEAGREGILPLTDSQQMELLGQAIGKYITINASIVNQMNGRVISRELQKIQNENSFANNL